MRQAVLISGSPSLSSKSRMLLVHAETKIAAAGWSTRLIDLSTLDAGSLLGRSEDQAVRDAIEAVLEADVVVAASPTYRATYTGLLKAFFDLLPQDSLSGKIGVPILTGGGPWHMLALDHGFRPLFASLGATVVAGVYGYDAQFKNGPAAELLDKVAEAAAQAIALAHR